MRLARSTTVIAATLALLVPGASGAVAAPVEPDIEMQPPYDLQLTTGDNGRSFVAFGAKVINKGPGVLKVVGERASVMDPTMNATQILLDNASVQKGKPARTVVAGEFQFSPSVDHNHWHYLRFEDYNLLTVPDLELAAPTRKTGFCLLGLNLDFWCAHKHPEFLSIGGPLDYANAPNRDTEAMGIVPEGSPDIALGNRASSDEYTPNVEGQDIEITNVPNGRYCLSFVVNPGNRLIERRYANNSASKLIDIGSAAGGERTLAEVDRGEFRDNPTCGMTRAADPGSGASRYVGLVTFSSSRSSRLALAGIERAVKSPRAVKRSCKVASVMKATCRVTFSLSGASYSGSATISQRLRAATGYWFYSLDVTRKRLGTCTKSKSCPRRIKTKQLLGGALGSNRVAAARALRLPAGEPAPVRPGVAWRDSWLPPEGKAQVRAYKPAG